MTLKITNGDRIKLMVIDQSGDKYYGTPEKVVLDMRMWDTSMGRCRTNTEYMKLVATRLPELPVCESEIQFLRTLEDLGRVKIHEIN